MCGGGPTGDRGPVQGDEMTGYTKITKEEFYNSGGFSNPRNVRVTRGKAWAHYQRWD